MKNRVFLGGGVVAIAIALAGCSPSPKVDDVDTDALIAACLDGATPVAQGSKTFIEGTVSSVNAESGDSGTDVRIVFDARDEDKTASPAQCTMTVESGQVTETSLGGPDSDHGTEVEDAAERWNDKHAEDWVDGSGPDPVDAPPMG